jgi:hypothetical protein
MSFGFELSPEVVVVVERITGGQILADKVPSPFQKEADGI